MSNEIRTRRFIVTVPNLAGEASDELATTIEDYVRQFDGREDDAPRSTVTHALDDAQVQDRVVRAHRGGTVIKDPYVSIRVTDFTGDYSDTFDPDDARKVAALLLRAADEAEGQA